MVIAKVGDGGQISLFNFAGSVDLIVDVLGWFPTVDRFTGVDPARLLDTRPGSAPAGQRRRRRSVPLDVTGGRRRARQAPAQWS